MNKVPQEEIEAKVSNAARILKLEPYLKRKPKALSGGQRQRVAIGRAIVRGPEVFLFDEPLSNLDAELRVEMRVEIAKLHKQLGSTMIYVTHDQIEAMTLADKIVVLRAGHIEQAGTPLELYNDPDNQFVAGFIGSPAMNFLRAEVTEKGLKVPALGGLEIKPIAQLPEVGTAVTVGLRPQAISLEVADSGPLEIEISEELGGLAYAYLSTATDERIVVEVPGQHQAPAGLRARVTFGPQDLFVFDETSGTRIR